MATPVELERLIVRLVGESSSYMKMVNQAIISGKTVRSRLLENAKAIETATKMLMEHGAQVTTKAITPLEKYQLHMKELDALLKKNAISQQTYNSILEKEYNRLPGVAKAQRDYIKAVKDREKAVVQAAKREQYINDQMTDATIRRLQKELKAAEKRVVEEDRAFRRLEKIKSKYYADEEKKAERAAKNLEKIRSRAFLDEEKLTKKMEKESQKRIAAMEEFGRRTSQVMRTAGFAMTATVTAPVIAFGKKSVSAFADFDDAMVGSLAVMENVTPNMQKRMEGLAVQISDNSITSAKDLGESYYFLASAGQDAEQSLASLTKVEKFAVAGRFQMQKATELLLDSQTALGLRSRNTAEDVKNLARVSDVLVKADTIANASVEQFARSLTTKAGNALRLLNKDIEEGVAVLSAYAAQGVKAELAGERLYIVLRDLERSSRTNAREFEHFGIRVYDSHGKMRRVSDVLRDMEKAMKGMSDQERAATFAMLGFQDRSVAAIKGLIGMSDQIDYFHEKLKSAAGFTESVANKQLQSFKNQMLIIGNRVYNVSIDIGKLLVPSIKSLVTWVEDLVKWWKTLSDEQKNSVIRWAAVAASIGPVLLLLSKTITTVLALRSAFVALAASSALAKIGMTQMGVVAGGAMVAGFYIATRAILEFGFGLSKIRNEINKLNEESQAKLSGTAREENRWLSNILGMEDKGGAKDILHEQLRKKEQEIRAGAATLAAAKAELDVQDTAFNNTVNNVYGHALLMQAKGQYDRVKAQLQATIDFKENIKDAINSIDQEMNRIPMNTMGEHADGDFSNMFPDFKELERAEKAFERVDQQLKLQAETLGLTEEEVKVYKLALMGATAEEIAVAKAAAAAIKEFDKEKKALEEIEKAAEKALHPFEKFKIEESKLNNLFDDGLISLAAFNYHMRELRGELAKDLNVKFKVTGMEGVEAKSLEAIGKREAFRLAHILPRATLERAGADPDIAEEFKRDGVKGFGREKDKASRSTLEELLKKIEENTRRDPGTVAGKKHRPIVAGPAGLTGEA